MTTGGVLLALGSIILFVISVIVLAVRAYKKKTKKAPTVMMIISVGVMIISFFLNKMYGYAIGAVALTVFFTFITWSIKNHNKKQQEYDVLIEKNPAWEVEKKVRDRLKYISFGKASSFSRYPSYMDSKKYNRYLSDNQSKCAEFLNDGALMVASHQCVDPNSLSNNGQALYIYTPHAVFRKWTLPSGTTTTDILPAGLGLGIKEYHHTTVVTKDASVTGSAIAGAVIGGTAGAVVGAVHAMETNAKGGKSKVVSDGTKTYNIQVFDHWIDCVLISKEVLKMCPPPLEDAISVETDTYWVLDRYLSGAKKDEVEEIRNYLNTIIAKIKIASEGNK